MRFDGPRTDQADIVRFLVNGDQAPVKIIDPMSAATYIRYAASAPLLPDSITYANGNVVRMRYDSRARLEWTQTSNFNGGRDSTTFAYQGTVPDQPSQVSVPLNGTNRLTGSFSYNSNGTLHQSTDPRGQVTTYAYNSRGQVDAVTMASVPVFVSSAQPRVVSNLVTRFYYNSLANTDSVKSDQGRVTHLQYDAYGNVIVRANPLQKDSFVYNALNQQIAMVQRDGSTTFPTTMQYNPDGALTVRTDPRSVVRQWEYDGSGRDTAEVDEFSKRAIKRYDPAGNVIVTISRQGDQTSSTYDAGGRLEQTIMNEVRVDNAADETLYRESINTVLVPADTLKYEYGVPGTTLVTRAANRNAVIRRTYSVEGALLTEMDSVKFINPVQVHTKTYTYNAAGARQSFTTPAARSISYNFSTHGDLSSIVSPAGSSVFAWHALGGRDSLYLPDGTATKYRYDSDGLLRTLYAYHPVSSPVNGYKGIVDQAFYYDAAGRPDSMIDRSITAQGGSGDKSIFTYDGRGQIKTHSAPSGTTTYSYDASGNRVTETSAAGTFTHNIAALTNRISTRSEPLGTRYYRYDGNGGVVSDSTKQPVSNIGPSNWYSRSVRTFYDAAGRATIIKMDSIAYNSSQQMISTFSPAALDYRYDALGRALLRQDGTGGQIPVVPDGDNLVALGSANPVEIVSAPGIDEPLMLLPPSGQGICGYSAAYFITYRGRLYDYHRPNGTSCIEAGNVGWETYGRNAGPIANSHSFGMARAQGRNGLSFFRNRLYDSNSGRFTQEDPIGFDGGDNLYAYGDNNPAALTDAFGLSATATQDTIYTRWKRPRIDMSDPGRQRMRAALPSTPHVSYMACLGQIGSTAFSIAVDASVLLGVGAGVKGMQFGWTMGREAMKAYGSHALGLATLGQRAQATASVGRATGRVLVAEGQAGFGAAAANAEFSWSRALAPFVPGWNSISTAADVPAACSSR